jgi:HEAT repeat protein
MVRKYLNYIIFGAVVLLVVGLALSHSSHMRYLVEEMAGSDPRAQSAAAAELIKGEQFSDTITGEPVETRVKAAEALEVLGGDTSKKDKDAAQSSDAVKQLLSMLKDTDKPVRERATLALSHIGAKSAENLKELVVGLKDGDTNVRKGTIAALNAIGPKTDPDVEKAIVDLMKAEATARGPGGDVLGDKVFAQGAGREESTRLLIAQLADKDGGVRGGAADALGKVGDVVAVAPLKEAMHTDADPQVRRIAIGSIALIADRSGEDALAEAIDDPTADNEARLQAAAGLGKIGTPTAIDTLIKALDDKDLKLRSAAVAALARAGHPAPVAPVNSSVLATLTRSLSDTRAAVRLGAAQALQIVLSEAADAARDPAAQQATSVLIGLVNNQDKDNDLRAAAAMALGFKDDKRAVAPLIQALSDPSGDVEAAARDSLAGIGPAATDALIAVMSRGNSDAYYASKALARQGDAALPALERAAQNSANPVGQRWAAVALGDLGVAGANKTLQQLAQSSDPDVAYVAKAQLNQLGQAQ